MPCESIRPQAAVSSGEQCGLCITEIVHDAATLARLSRDGGEARPEPSRRAAVAIRAEVGWLPLPRIQGSLGRGAALEVGPTARSLLSGDRRRTARAQRPALRARRRAGRAGRPCPFI